MQGRGRGGSSSNGEGRGRESMSYANAAHVATPQHVEQANYVVTDKDRDGVTGLSDVQWRNIMNILNANAGKNNNTTSENLTGSYVEICFLC